MKDAGKEGPRDGSKSRGKPARILVVDDHPIVREALQQLISQELDLRICGEASDAATAWDSVMALHPDAVIVDIALESGNGIELTERIRTAYPDLPVLVFSMHDEPHCVERAVRAGARGYVTKSDASDRIIPALRKILSGQLYLEDHLSPELLQSLSGVRDPGEDDSPLESLSGREREVFRLIGLGLGTREIGEKLHLGRKTVDTYQYRIRGKLALKSTRSLVQYAIRWTLCREGVLQGDRKPEDDTPAGGEH